jgi:hypothetical protein
MSWSKIKVSGSKVAVYQRIVTALDISEEKRKYLSTGPFKDSARDEANKAEAEFKKAKQERRRKMNELRMNGLRMMDNPFVKNNKVIAFLKSIGVKDFKTDSDSLKKEIKRVL